MAQKFTQRSSILPTPAVLVKLQKVAGFVAIVLFAGVLATQTNDYPNDQDGDGIEDIYDLDDDNDGIPDDLECSGLTTDGVVSVINGAFNDPDVDDPVVAYVKSWGSTDKAVLYNDSDVPGWETTATDSKIEIWENGFGGVQGYTGHQFAEINANQNAALYQDIASTPEGVMTWSFAHRGRGSRTVDDSMRLLIGPPGGPYTEEGRFGTNSSAWAHYKGTYTVPTGQTTTRFLYEAISTASGSPGSGNFLDAVRFYSSSVDCPVNTDGDSLSNSLDLDSDGDGIADLVEAGGVDSDQNGIVDDLTDTDGDGLVDLYDTDMTDGPLVSGCELGVDCDLSGSTSSLFDTDFDGLNDTEGDFDGDGLPNWADLDSDDDGIIDATELDTLSHAGSYFASPIDFDGDGNPDYLDIDADHDGIIDLVEAQSSAGYMALSGNDQDRDGIDDSFDQFNGFGGTGLNPVNTDLADQPDYRDLDSDNDLVSDEVEAYDTNGDGVADQDVNGLGVTLGQDVDNDGLDDGFDQNTSKVNPANKNETPMDFPIHSSSGNPVWRNVGGQFPVEWLGFEGKMENGGVQLSWITATELNSDYFEVQRTYDGKNYESLGRVEAVGNSQSAQSYRYFDAKRQESAKNLVVYRLKQVDLDGAFDYSKRIEIQITESFSQASLTAFPSPTIGPLTLRWNMEGLDLTQAKYEVLDLSGRLMQKGSVPQSGQEIQLDVSSLSPGNYLVRITDDNLNLSRKFVKQ
ncbi:MAG: T9SS type A sorting domain-containing protein [Bacteroidota bacterium]